MTGQSEEHFPGEGRSLQWCQLHRTENLFNLHLSLMLFTGQIRRCSFQSLKCTWTWPIKGCCSWPSLTYGRKPRELPVRKFTCGAAQVNAGQGDCPNTLFAKDRENLGCRSSLCPGCREPVHSHTSFLPSINVCFHGLFCVFCFILFSRHQEPGKKPPGDCASGDSHQKGPLTASSSCSNPMKRNFLSHLSKALCSFVLPDLCTHPFHFLGLCRFAWTLAFGNNGNENESTHLQENFHWEERGKIIKDSHLGNWGRGTLHYVGSDCFPHKGRRPVSKG